MTTTTDLLVNNAFAIGAAMLLLWLVSVAKKNASIVDIFWGLGFVGVAWLTQLQRPWTGAHSRLVAALVTLWGVRLALHLLVRNWGKPEDVRYQMLRQQHPPFWLKSLLVVFALQGVLLWMVSLPVQLSALSPAPLAADAGTIIGVAVFVAGFAFETVADFQLVRFKRDPKNRGHVMDRGLWAWSRHPNYFGEVVLWWGLYALAIAHMTSWIHIGSALLGPVTITTLILRVSGVPMLEDSMKKRRDGYAAYLASTSAFFPRPPRAR